MLKADFTLSDSSRLRGKHLAQFASLTPIKGVDTGLILLAKSSCSLLKTHRRGAENAMNEVNRRSGSSEVTQSLFLCVNSANSASLR